MLNQSYVSPNGERLVNEASEKLIQYMIDNHLTAEQVGIEHSGEYIFDPIRRYSTFLASIGFKHYF